VAAAACGLRGLLCLPSVCCCDSSSASLVPCPVHKQVRDTLQAWLDPAAAAAAAGEVDMLMRAKFQARQYVSPSVACKWLLLGKGMMQHDGFTRAPVVFCVQFCVCMSSRRNLSESRGSMSLQGTQLSYAQCIAVHSCGCSSNSRSAVSAMSMAAVHLKALG
jgi:hypothetical protein